MIFRPLSLWMTCCLACLCGQVLPVAVAQVESTKTLDHSSSNADTAEKEHVVRSALDFAKSHHPELAALVLQLKEMDLEKFQTAIAELHRTSERLVRLQERTPDRYETELKLWKIDSRVRLLVARSAGGMEEQTRSQIKELLLARQRLRFEQLVKDRARMAERLQRLDEQIVQANSEGDALVERDLNRLMTAANLRGTSRKKTANTRPQPVKTPEQSVPQESPKRPVKKITPP